MKITPYPLYTCIRAVTFLFEFPITIWTGEKNQHSTCNHLFKIQNSKFRSATGRAGTFIKTDCPSDPCLPYQAVAVFFANVKWSHAEHIIMTQNHLKSEGRKRFNTTDGKVVGKGQADLTVTSVCHSSEAAEAPRTNGTTSVLQCSLVLGYTCCLPVNSNKSRVYSNLL